MTWTYGDDPAANSRDAVRFLTGLNDKADQLITDEEIDYVLLETGDDVEAAAVAILDVLAAQFTRLYESRTLGERTEEYGDRAAKYRARSQEISGSGGATAAGPRAPQITVADREAALQSTARTPTQFFVGMMRNTRATTIHVPDE